MTGHISSEIFWLSDCSNDCSTCEPLLQLLLLKWIRVSVGYIILLWLATLLVKRVLSANIAFTSLSLTCVESGKECAHSSTTVFFFGVSIIHRTLTGTTESLTCVCELFICVYAGDLSL